MGGPQLEETVGVSPPVGIGISTEWKLRIAFAVALGCLVLVGMISALSLSRLNDAATWVGHTHSVLSTLNAVETASARSEAAERGYVVSQSQAELTDYRDALAVIESELLRLRDLVSDNPGQAQRVDELTDALRAQAELFRSVITLRDSEGFDAARQRISSRAVKESEQRIATLVDEIAAAETELLEQRDAEASARSSIAYAVILSGSLLGVGMVVAALLVLRREFAARQRAERQLRTANDELESRVRERTQELENSAKSLERTASALEEEVATRRASQHKLQAQLHRMDLLNQITRAIGERQDLVSIFQVVISAVERHMPAEFACGLSYDPATKQLTVMGVGTASEERARQMGLTYQASVPIDKNGLSRCVRGELVYEPRVVDVPFPFPQRLAAAGLGSVVAAPLLTESKVFGILLCARTRQNAFDSGECEFLRQLSEHVALAAHQAQLYGALQNAYDELRQSQRAALQQERLLALGQLASGIAHDINNAITPISLYTDSILDREKNLSDTGRSHLEMVQRAIGDIAQTVARMREFYRQREVQTTLLPVDVNRLAAQVMDLTRARWYDMSQQRGVDIEFRLDLGPDIPLITGVEGELRDALVNLVFNAVDAMPDGGQVTVRTRMLVQPAADGSPGRSVKMEVIDTGVGMDEDTRRRCLEPFFTTKGERGTGLGLAMVYGTMQRHSADIQIESEPGKGTTFSFVFPVQAMEMSGASVAATFMVPDLHILVVDDDPLVSAAVSDRLRGEGHRVTTADGGKAGVNEFRNAKEQGDPFDVVITDLGMPQMDGRAVSTAIKAISPKTPIIMLTGWGQRMQEDGDIPSNVDYMLSKPPKLQDIRAALAHCLAIPR